MCPSACSQVWSTRSGWSPRPAPSRQRRASSPTRFHLPRAIRRRGYLRSRPRHCTCQPATDMAADRPVQLLQLPPRAVTVISAFGEHRCLGRLRTGPGQSTGLPVTGGRGGPAGVQRSRHRRAGPDDEAVIDQPMTGVPTPGVGAHMVGPRGRVAPMPVMDRWSCRIRDVGLIRRPGWSRHADAEPKERA